MVRVSQNISQEYLSSKIENLTAFGTRYAHADNHPQVIDWIYNEFEQMGYEPVKWSFSHQGDGNLANIVVNVNGTGSDEFYIVSAHLDSFNLNYSWSFPNHVAPGADDDATGIAAMLAIADALQKYHFKYGIRFIAFDAEELYKAVGSKRYLENMTDTDKQNLRGVLNIDMIGYNPSYIRSVLDYTTPSLGMITDYVDPINNEFYFITHLYKFEDPLSSSSWGDVTTFWNAGFMGITFSETINPRENGSFYKANPFYHTENDTLDKLNMELVTRTTQLVVCSVMMMAQPTLPELFIKNIALPKGPYFDAGPMILNATVTNSGNLNASNVRVDMTIDGDWTGSTNISVPAKTSMNATFNWTTIAGDHTFDFVVDKFNELGEWDDSNNTASMTIHVQVRPDIELDILNITEDWINTGELATISVAARNNGPTYIECTFTVTDSMAPTDPVFSEFVGINSGAEWKKVFNWGSNVNGTHFLEGRFSKCSPPDRVPSNNIMTDLIIVNGFPQAILTAQPMNGALTYQDLTFRATSSFDDVGVDEYLFDFGDEWPFEATLQEIRNTPHKGHPKILEKKGKAPAQYGDEIL